MRLGPREVDKLALHAAGAALPLAPRSPCHISLRHPRHPSPLNPTPSPHAGALAQKRLANGVRLNHPEAVALIASQCLEFIREGSCSVAELMDLGRTLLGHRQVLPGVATLVAEVQVEGTFRDGTKLVTIHSPINRKDGDLKLALKARKRCPAAAERSGRRRPSLSGLTRQPFPPCPRRALSSRSRTCPPSGRTRTPPPQSPPGRWSRAGRRWCSTPGAAP